MLASNINSYKVCQTGAECDGHGGLFYAANKLYDEILLLIQMYSYNINY